MIGSHFQSWDDTLFSVLIFIMIFVSRYNMYHNIFLSIKKIVFNLKEFFFTEIIFKIEFYTVIDMDTILNVM